MPPDLNEFTVFPEKLAVTDLVSKFILFFGIRMFVIMYKEARHYTVYNSLQPRAYPLICT